MFNKTSELKEKSEFDRIKKDYTNNYGYNIGLNSYASKRTNDKLDNFNKGNIIMKKR